MKMIPADSTMMFNQIFKSKEDFLSDYKNSGLIEEDLPDEAVTKIYCLLAAKHNHSATASRSPEQFKLQVFSIIYQYGPTWWKKLDIQKKLRNLTDDDLLKGNKTIINSALNPSTYPSTSSIDELETINSQNTNTLKRGKVEGYASLAQLLEDDITKMFLDRFDKLFALFVKTRPVVYLDCDEEEEE